MWLDYQKAFDSVLHKGLIKALELAKVWAKIVNALKKVIKKWATNIHLDMFIKKVPFLAKAWDWCLHLHLDCSKFDLSSCVITSVPLVKLKGWSFQFWSSHQKQTKHSGDIAIFFTVIFMILVECKCIF